MRKTRHDRKGFIPQRAISDPLSLTSTKTPLTNSYQTLELLPDIHPSVSMALWTATRLMWNEEYKITCHHLNGLPHVQATKIIDTFLSSLPQELGGVHGLLETWTSELFLTGMACVEIVPGGELEGVAELYPVASKSIYFFRDDLKSRPMPYQRGYPTMGMPPYTPLSEDTFFYTAIDRGVDIPYGRAPYATALAEALNDIGMNSDLLDAIHNAAYPRLNFRYDIENLYKTAVDILRKTSPNEAREWVEAQIALIKQYAEEMNPDDNLVSDIKGGIDVVPGGDFSSLRDIFSFERQRMVTALKSLPTLLGANDGATFNYTSVEWSIYAASLESVRKKISDLLLKCLNKHLQLMGISAITKAEYPKIKTNDELTDANTENVKQLNANNRIKMGWTTDEEECQIALGHKPRAERQVTDIGGTENMARPVPNNSNKEGTFKQ